LRNLGRNEKIETAPERILETRVTESGIPDGNQGLKSLGLTEARGQGSLSAGGILVERPE
jgi:hypothetical protein